jgi:hypothetical protein
VSAERPRGVRSDTSVPMDPGRVGTGRYYEAVSNPDPPLRSTSTANVAATTPRARQPFISHSVDRARAALADAEIHLHACRMAYLATLEHERARLVRELDDSERERAA